MSFFMGLFKFLNAISLLGSGNVRFLLLNFFAMGFFGEAHFTDGCATLGRHKEYYLMWPKIKAVLFEFVNGDVKRCSNAELKCFDEKSIKIFWLKSPAEIFIRLDTKCWSCACAAEFGWKIQIFSESKGRIGASV
jgi:hypothetical protein